MAEPTLQRLDTDAEASLEQRFSKADAAVFDDVIEYYLPEIQRLVHRLLAWSGETDDVVQDVFTAAFINRKRFRAQSSLKTWLFTITINTCRTRNRRHLLWRRFVKNRSGCQPSTVRCATEDAYDQEKNQKVQLAVRQLPSKYRDAVVLKYLEELPTPEILAILKITEQTLYTRLYRARNLLQQNLLEYLEDEQ